LSGYSAVRGLLALFGVRRNPRLRSGIEVTRIMLVRWKYDRKLWIVEPVTPAAYPPA